MLKSLTLATLLLVVVGVGALPIGAMTSDGTQAGSLVEDDAWPR